MFRIPRPVTDDADAPDEFRTVLASKDRWWRAGNAFHLTLGSALRSEFVEPFLRAAYWPYVTLATHFGRFEVRFYRRDTKSWEHWTYHFTEEGGERVIRRFNRAIRDTEMKVVRRPDVRWPGHD